MRPSVFCSPVHYPHTLCSHALRRCQRYLNARTKKPLISIMEDALLQQHMPLMLERDFSAVAAAGSLDELKRLYR